MSFDTKGPVDQIINFTRGSCYGTCPIFEFNLFSDGKMYLEGKRFLEHIGIFSAQLSPQEFQALINTIEKSKMDKWAPEYQRDIADIPSFGFQYTKNEIKKSVIGNGNVPDDLNIVFNKLDTIVHSKIWIKENEMAKKYDQADGFIKDEIIIELKENSNFTDFLKPFAQFDTKLLKTLSASKRTYLITYDKTKVRSNAMLEMCKQNENVVHASFNQVVKLRGN